MSAPGPGRGYRVVFSPMGGYRLETDDRKPSVVGWAVEMTDRLGNRTGWRWQAVVATPAPEREVYGSPAEALRHGERSDRRARRGARDPDHPDPAVSARPGFLSPREKLAVVLGWCVGAASAVIAGVIADVSREATGRVPTAWPPRLAVAFLLVVTAVVVGVLLDRTRRDTS